MRQRGRPRIDPTDESVQVSISVSGKMYADFRAQATRDGVTVPEVVRRRLRNVVAEDRRRRREEMEEKGLQVR